MRVMKKILKYLSFSLLAILVIFSLYTFVATKVLHKEYVNVFGHTYFLVASGSMSGTIEVNDIVIVKINGKYKEKDIVTFKKDGSFITHRVMKIKEDRVITRGDVNNTDDDPVNKKDIIGRVVFVISISLILKIIAVLFFVLLIFIVINFDRIFKDYIFVDNIPDGKAKNKLITKMKHKKIKVKEEEKTDENVVEVIEIDDSKDIKKINESISEVEIISKDNSLLSLREDEKNPVTLTRKRQKDFLLFILNLIKKKNEKIKITKDGSKKLLYLYQLANTFLISPENIKKCLYDLPFKELYNYNFEDIYFVKEIQDELYEMPAYVYLRLLIYATIYDEAEYFDAVFKLLKYRILITPDKMLIIDEKDIERVLILLETIIVETSPENIMDLKKIRERIEVNKSIYDFFKKED